MIDITTVIKALPYLIPGMKAAVEVEQLVTEVIGGFDSNDQAHLKTLLVQLQKDNDLAHEQLQQELGEAEKK